jgi:hypothetical protein
MAERIVSPGVFTRENDLSFLSQGIGEIGAAFIGPFKEGPAFVPTLVRTQSEFEELFGTPDGTYYTDTAVQNYLREAGVATIVRVGGVGGYVQTAPLAIIATGSGQLDGGGKIVGTLYSTQVSTGANPQTTGFTGVDVSQTVDISGSFSFVGGLDSANASILPSNKNDLSDLFGTSPYGIGPSGSAKLAYSYLYFENFAAGLTGTYSITSSLLPTQDYSNGGTDEIRYATTPWVISQQLDPANPNSVSDLFRFHTIGDGAVYNTKFKVAISNVKAAGEDGSTDYSVFSVTVRRFDDTDRRKVVLETFNNVNLDPVSPNYIARVIGDRNVTIDSNGKLSETGDYANRSKYIRVEVSIEGSFPVSAAPFGHKAYYAPINDGANGNLLPSITFATGSANNTPSSPINFSGIEFGGDFGIDNRQIFKPIPTAVRENDISIGQNFSFDTAPFEYELTGSAAVDMVRRQFILGFQEGFDGLNPVIRPKLGADIEGANTQGFNCANSAESGSIAYAKAIAAVSNPDEFDINMVVTPGIIRELHSSVTQRVIDMVESRQDAFYIADFVALVPNRSSEADISQATFQASQVDTNYAATYYPWVKTIDSNTNKLLSVPPSVLLPAVFASNDRLAAEWFAPAGLNRGGITGAVNVLNRLTHSERDTLYENKVNPIAVFPGQGIVAYGQKTLQDRASALDRINVRRLLITVKKFVASTSRFLVFEQNTSTTRSRFLNTVNPYFEAIQQRQGLYAFNVVMDESNNTPDVIDRNILAGQIFLQPAKTAEFIVIDFNILPTGASFSA